MQSQYYTFDERVKLLYGPYIHTSYLHTYKHTYILAIFCHVLNPHNELKPTEFTPQPTTFTSSYSNNFKPLFRVWFSAQFVSPTYILVCIPVCVVYLLKLYCKINQGLGLGLLGNSQWLFLEVGGCGKCEVNKETWWSANDVNPYLI